MSVLCDSCLAVLEPVQGRRCECCGIKLLSEINLCTRCRERCYAFAAHRSVFMYRGLVKELIYQFKFRQNNELTGLLAYYLAMVIEHELPVILPRGLSGYGLPELPLVPVPASPGRKMQRRAGIFPVNRSAVQRLAAWLERHYGYKICDCLSCYGKAPQKELDFATRLQNVKGRFAVKPIQHGKGRRATLPEQVILLDDIFTTGATADECTRILLEAGVRHVYVITLAMD